MNASDRWLLQVVAVIRGVLDEGPLVSPSGRTATAAPLVRVVYGYVERGVNLRPRVSSVRERFPGVSDRLGQAATTLIQRFIGLGRVGYAWARGGTEGAR